MTADAPIESSRPSVATRTVCTRCVCDTTIPGIRFDSNGVCTYCRIHDAMERRFPLGQEGQRRLQALVARIQSAGRGHDHDCIVGVSGGADSTYCLLQAVRFGLRPLAVHLDNGWNSSVAETNIRNAVDLLKVPLRTATCDLEEFNDIQRAFLRASVPDAEVPTDVAIIAALYGAAEEQGIKYVLNGHSFRAEGVSPLGWTYMDGRYIATVHSRYGQVPMRTFPNLTISALVRYAILRRIRTVPLLAYIDYNKAESKAIVAREVGWQDYGGHHHESVYTKFVATVLLPRKFGIDKRIIEYSAHIRSGQMMRDEALARLAVPEPVDPALEDECRTRLGIDETEWQTLMSAPVRSFRDYGTYFPFIKLARPAIWLACRMSILPHIFYEKYFA